MADVVDKATRSRMMSSIRSKNTLPELQVRSLLHRAGFRFRLHRSDLPGKPDLVLPKTQRSDFCSRLFLAWPSVFHIQMAKIKCGILARKDYR